MLKTLAEQRRVLMAGTKSADIFKAPIRTTTANACRIHPLGLPLSGNRRGRAWSSGAARSTASSRHGIGGGGLAAIQPATDERAWLFTPPPPAGGGRRRVQRAAATAIPASSSRARADSARHQFRGRQAALVVRPRSQTINRVFPAHGGAISTSGAVIVDGMVYVGSGYAVGSSASGGNVLLAFGTD